MLMFTFIQIYIERIRFIWCNDLLLLFDSKLNI